MEVLWKLINSSTSAPITGGAASTALKIRRGADGFLLDWTGLTFKAAAWTAPSTALAEVDAVNLPGMYAKSVTVTAWTDGWYQMDLTYSGSPAQYAQGETFLVGGEPVDEAYVAPDNTTITAINAKTTNLPADPASETNVNLRLLTTAYVAPDNTTISTINGKVDTIDTNVDTLLTNLATVDGIVDDILIDTGILTGGAGSRAVTIQLYETSTTTPIVDVNVAAYNAGGDLMAQATSSAAGQVLFALADGAHTVHMNKAGVLFSVTGITVSGSATFTLYGTPATIPAPITGDGCTVYDYCYDQASGSPLATVTATAEIIHLPYDYNGKMHTGTPITGTYSAASGIVSWEIARGADVVVDITELGIKHKITVPAAATARIADLL